MSTRRSSTGSASGGGSRGSRAGRGVTRLTSITRSVGGLCSSTPIRPPGAATTQVRRCCAANSARVPAGDHSPNSATARACSGSRPLAVSGPITAAASASDSRSPSGPGRPGAPGGRGAPGRARVRSTVAAVSGAVPSAPKPSRPSVSTVSSPRCRPSASMTVSSSPGSSSIAVTAPGCTRYRSSRGSAGSSPGRTRRGRSVDTVTGGSPPDGLVGLVLGRVREQFVRQGTLALRVERPWSRWRASPCSTPSPLCRICNHDSGRRLPALHVAEGTPETFPAKGGAKPPAARPFSPPAPTVPRRPAGARGSHGRYDSPTISPFSSRSIRAAAGLVPSPGMVRISPQIG